MVVVLHGFGVHSDNLGDVFNRSGSVVLSLVPGPIKHSHKLVFLISGIRVFPDFSVQCIGSRPLIAVNSLSCEVLICNKQHGED